MFLALSGDKQSGNYDTECSNHHPSLSTLRSKRLSCSKMKWWAIYTYSGMPYSDYPIRRVEIASVITTDFIAPSADKQTCNYDTECSNHHPSLSSTLRSEGLSRSKMKWWSMYMWRQQQENKKCKVCWMKFCILLILNHILLKVNCV